MFRWYLQQHLRDEKHLQWLAEKEFLRAIRTGRVIAFVGSYATEELGYPGWRTFLKKAARELVAGRRMPAFIQNAKQGIEDSKRGISPTLMFDLIEEWVIANDPVRKEDVVRDHVRREIAEGQFGLKNLLPEQQASTSPYHIAESLGIDRVITTNYDLEFEWLWMTTSDEKLRAGGNRQKFFEKLRSPRGSQSPVIEKDKAGGLIRKLPGGRSAISDVFNRERADRLIEFAVGSPDYEAHVMHLHGRSTDAKSLVVSLRDYQDQYRRSGITKLPFEHAQRMLFAGNPVIFIGLGMSEDLITTTLEQFVSDHPARHLAPAFLAPAFVIWSPELERGVPVEGSELLRLSWYRRFGVLTLFDCSLDTFRRGAKRTRVARSLKALGEYARRGIKPFPWQPKHFRSMQKRIDASGSNNRHEVWQRRPKPKDLPHDFFDGTRPSVYGPTRPGIDAVPDGPIFSALFRGPPIKAFIDRPGTGHGYLAKVISDAFAVQVNKVTSTECAIVNANFICEVDSAFALLSGLYDRKTAFSEGKSRGQALVEYQRQVWTGVVGQGLKASVLVVISGMDRFFDTSGYPLSNELDMTVRRLAPLYRMKFPDPDRNPAAGTQPLRIDLHQLIARRGLVNPYSIVLLGTQRVERYLVGLGLRPHSDGGSFVGDYEMMNHKVLDSGQTFREDVINRYRHGARPAALALPIEAQQGDELDSAYLRSIVSAFSARGVKPEQLSTSRQAIIDQARTRRPGDQRRSFLNAYLRSGTIMAALPKGQKNLADLCLDILSTMAFVGQPVEQEALERAPRVTKRLARRKTTAALTTAIDQLLNLNFLMEFEAFPDSPPTCRRFGLHRAVMAELRDRYGVPISDAKLSAGFNLSLFASQPVDDYTPEEEMHKELGELIDAMLGAVEDDKPGLLDPRVSIWLRAAQSVMRSYFTTAALLTHKPPEGAQEEPSAPLSDHARRLEHLIRLGEEAAAARSKSRGNPGVTLGPEPFFPDDLVWLYNELGVVRLAQGDLYEARQAFDRALAINTAHVEYSDRLQNWRRIQLNQLHVDFERGKIDRAQSRILEIEQSINDQADALFELTGEIPQLSGANSVDDIIFRFGRERLPQTRVVDSRFPADLILSTGLVTGYRGLCSHVRGEIETATQYFADAVEIFRNIGEQRAYAWFQRHRALLLFASGALPEYKASIDLCVAAANSSRQMDIAHLASVTEAEHRMDVTGSTDAVLPKMIESLRYSAKADMYRVRMEVRRALAHVRLAAGDYDGALEHATEAMSVATRFGFNLRKISLRILIGEILIRRGDPVSGNALIERAIRNADRVGFQHAVELSRQVRLKYDPSISN